MAHEIAAILGTILISASWIPQIYKTLKTRNSHGVSFGTPLILIAAGILWTYYGIVVNNPTIWVSNIIITLIVVFAFIMILRYRQKK